MDKTQYLLTVVAEECSEVAYEACKGSRFGLDDKDPNDPAKLPNCLRLLKEYYQLQAVVEYMQSERLLTSLYPYQIQDIKGDKVHNLEKFMAYSREAGKLND